MKWGLAKLYKIQYVVSKYKNFIKIYSAVLEIRHEDRQI